MRKHVFGTLLRETKTAFGKPAMIGVAKCNCCGVEAKTMAQLDKALRSECNG